MNTNESSERMPPHDRPSERSLLGSMLRDNKLIPEIVGAVRVNDFYVFAHSKIFEAMINLADKGKEVDIVTVADWLTRKKLIDEIGGHAYVADLYDAAPSAGHFRQYAATIRDYAQRRQLIHAAKEIDNEAYDLGTPANELTAQAETKIFELANTADVGESVDLHVALNETMQRLDARTARTEEFDGVPTGFVDLDAVLCGMKPAELVILAARTSIGKTALALNIVRHVAIDEKMPTLFVSLEQGRTELAERLLCAQARVDSYKLRRGHFSADDMERLMVANDVLTPAPLMIDDGAMQDMFRIAANARRQKSRRGIQFLVVDYLQLVTPDNYRLPREIQVATVSKRLKGLARELKIPVLALCQVNRGPEDRTSKQPRLSDLRESGAIEQDADTVIMLHRADDTGLIDVNVAKQRNGPTGEVKLMFVKNFMRFENAAMATPGYGEIPA